jgi:hypothetical protein
MQLLLQQSLFWLQALPFGWHTPASSPGMPISKTPGRVQTPAMHK